MKFKKTVLLLPCIVALGGCAGLYPSPAPYESPKAAQKGFGGPREEEHLLYENGATDPLPELTEKSNLQNYLAYAALNNPGLRAAFHRWKAAVERIPQARALPDPRFTYGYFVREIETRVGPQRQRLGISQMFPWFGKLRLRADVASKAAMVAQQQYEAAKLKLFYRVRSAYAEYYHLSRAVAITRENVALVRYLEQVARTRYMAAAAGHPNMIRAQLELGKLEDRLNTLKDLRGPLAAKLNAVLGRSADQPVPWPHGLPAERIQADDEELLAWLKEANPELRALESEIGKRQSSVELARKNYYPDITLGLNYMETGPARMSGVRDSGKDPVMAMVSLNLPIWRGKYEAATRQAEAQLRSAQNSLRDKENTLESDVKLAAYAVRDAERKLDLYQNMLIPKAKESLKVTEIAFKVGKAGFLDLLDGQRALLEFQLSYERSLADHAQRVAQLEMLVGKEVPRSMPTADDVGAQSETTE